MVHPVGLRDTGIIMVFAARSFGDCLKRGADFESDSAKYLIYPVFEGSPIELRDLDKISRVAMSSRKDLIVATVDRLSKPIYYSIKKFEILNKKEP